MQTRRRNTFLLLTAAVLTASVAAACSPGDPFRSTGSYPIDVFQEMHYNQTQKSQGAAPLPAARGFLSGGGRLYLR